MELQLGCERVVKTDEIARGDFTYRYWVHLLFGSCTCDSRVEEHLPAELHLETCNEFVEIRAEFDLLLC